MECTRPFWSVQVGVTHEIEQHIVSVNYTSGRIYPPIAIVIHSMTDVPDDDISAVANWFNNPDSQVSAHYGISTGGKIWQFVDLKDTAWANGTKSNNTKWKWAGNPNPRTVSIETEGGPDDPVTTEMYDAVLYTCKRVLLVYPTINYLYAHSAIANTQCPGPRWTQDKMQKLASEFGLAVVI